MRSINDWAQRTRCLSSSSVGQASSLSRLPTGSRCHLGCRAKDPGFRDSYSGTGFPAAQDDSLERACPEPVEGLSHYQTTKTRGNDTPEDSLQVDDFFHEFQTCHAGALNCPNASSGNLFELGHYLVGD